MVPPSGSNPLTFGLKQHQKQEKKKALKPNSSDGCRVEEVVVAGQIFADPCRSASWWSEKTQEEERCWADAAQRKAESLLLLLVDWGGVGGGMGEGLMKTKGKIKRKRSIQGKALIILNLHQSSFCTSQLCHQHLWLDEEPPSDVIVYYPPSPSPLFLLLSSKKSSRPPDGKSISPFVKKHFHSLISSGRLPRMRTLELTRPPFVVPTTQQINKCKMHDTQNISHSS